MDGRRADGTLGDSLRIRHVHCQSQGRVSTDAGVGYQAGRNGDDMALAGEMATPPVSGQQLKKLGLGVDFSCIDTGPRPEVFSQGGF